MAKNINIGGRLHSIATGNVVVETNEVFDTNKGKKQNQLNIEMQSSIDAEIERAAGVEEGLSNRLEAVEQLAEISVQGGTLELATSSSDIESGSSKVPTANAVNEVLQGIGYFECSTDADISAKTITATGYSLRVGGNIRIKMTSANTADAVTLNINNTGAKALYYNGEQASSANSWEAGEVVEVYYDGTQFMASNSQGGGNLSIIHEIDTTTEYTDKDVAGADAVQGVMVEGTARTITNFDDWEEGCYDTKGEKQDVSLLLYKTGIVKLLKGQTITTLTQGDTYIAELDFTRLATHTGWRQGATEYTNTSNKNKLIRVVVSIAAGGGAQTVPSVVTLSDVGKDVEKKSNVVGWGEGEVWEDTVSALDLKDTVITTEKDAFWERGVIKTDGGLHPSNNAAGLVYIFENTGYRYLYAYNLAGNNRYYRSCALYSGEPSAEACIKLFSFPSSGIIKTDIPSNCRYIYVSAYNNTDISVNKRQTKILLFKDSSLLSFKYLLENFQLVKDTTIFDATNDLPALYDKYGRYIDIRNNFAYPGAATSNFRFIFCSDVHKNTDAFERIINITNRWAADGCVDALINTGDVAYDRPDESYDWYNQMRIQSNVDVLTVAGNHDWDYYIGGNKERTYNNIIAPMVSGAEGTVDNIVQPSDASEAFRFYYYKDYKTVRFIAIYASVDSTEQLEWLRSVLEDARTNNKHVIIGNHQSFASGLANMKYATPDAWYNNVPNTFFSGFGSIQYSSFNAGVGGDITAAYCQAVKDFMDAGGVFVCWISGHHHIDHFYDLNDTDTYGHQLMLNTGCVRQDELDGDSVRKGSIGNKDLYNFVSVSTDMKMLKVLRIGSNVDYLGRSKIVFTYNYGIHKIITNY